jgi:RimJ/RimL family protein N-acetyltransferase
LPVARFGQSMSAYDPDDLIWRFMPFGPFGSSQELGAVMHFLSELPDALVLSVVDLSSGELLGSVSYIANVPMDLKIEIGAVWYSPVVQRMGINTETVRLLVHHIMKLGYQRIEWKCHSENLRSRAAAESLGFRFEGIQDAHSIQKNRRRDTAWFRILAEEHRQQIRESLPGSP